GPAPSGGRKRRLPVPEVPQPTGPLLGPANARPRRGAAARDAPGAAAGLVGVAPQAAAVRAGASGVNPPGNGGPRPTVSPPAHRPRRRAVRRSAGRPERLPPHRIGRGLLAPGTAGLYAIAAPPGCVGAAARGGMGQST